MPESLKLFINYRRADYADFVQHMRTWFMHRYGRENVFMDFDTIPPFARFEEFIREKVRECDALVAVIGPRWAELIRERKASGRPDYVRVELEEALRHGKVIAPICIKDAHVPPEEETPDILRPIFARNVPSLRSGKDILDDIFGIMDALEAELAAQGKQRQTQQPEEAHQPAEEVGVHEALDRYYAALQNDDLTGALIQLSHMRESGAAIPGFINLDEQEAEIQARIKEEEEARRRQEVADYLYGFVRVMARYDQDVCEAMQEIWRVVPDYDPDHLGQGCLEVSEPEPEPGPPAYDPILDILPTPFEWCAIPARQVNIEGQAFDVQPFFMAKYQTTYEQFQVFINAADGFHNDEWWLGLAKRESKPGNHRFTHAENLPRENVSWYDAVAFCRWLSSKVGYEVRLPTEWEWQWAAQGPDGRAYPWGDEYIQGYANIDEKNSGISGGTYLEKTTPVGSYPKGASPYGVLDMSGNVWEWCLNEYDNPGQIETTGNARRVLRGGSWSDADNNARAGYRDDAATGILSTVSGTSVSGWWGLSLFFSARSAPHSDLCYSGICSLAL
jgi:hypothetical protein